jgi:hypothetical protein
MIHAFLDEIRYITIELNGCTPYDTCDEVPCHHGSRSWTRRRFDGGSMSPEEIE